jgi:hypothetical protein
VTAIEPDMEVEPSLTTSGAVGILDVSGVEAGDVDAISALASMVEVPKLLEPDVVAISVLRDMVKYPYFLMDIDTRNYYL